MKMPDKIFLLLFGLTLWTIGTLWYRARGVAVFETSSLHYWINFVGTPILSAVVCLLMLKWRHIPAPHWASAALLIAVPGIFGEALVLSNFAFFMPELQPATAGKYGAFLFAAYALFLAIAEAVTLGAT